jgi:Cu(I)/Ag(I) efflux system membrane fusion protein
MNRTKITAIALASLAVLAAAGWGAYQLGMQRGMSAPSSASSPATMPSAGAADAPAASSTMAQSIPQSIAQGEEATRRHITSGLKAGDTDPSTGSKILYYHDPMVPGNKFDKPAKSPFMDMMLVPVYADPGTDQGNVTVSPRIQQNLGVRTAVATQGTLSVQLAAVGNIVFNERDQAVVQARAAGFVERLNVRATLDRVTKGQVLAELYVPDWVAAQEEFLAVRRMQGPDTAVLVDGARARMRQAGMSDEQIAKVERSAKPAPRIAITAPTSGLVTELAVREGMSVMPGATLFRINGFATVWANAEVPEGQAALLRPGALVRAQTPAVPGTFFEGRVQALLPDVSTVTRTLKARVELANPRGQLVPGMSVTMQFTDMQPRQVLLVPTESVIQTGKRTVLMLAADNGRFRPIDVQVGAESGGQTEITRGLQAGQRVVVSSQFLIDSEASLKGLETRLNGDTQGQTQAPAMVQPTRHKGEGKVVAISGSSAVIAHGPLTTAGMGPMTMEFVAPAQGMPKNIAKGDQVQFEFVLPKDEAPTLTQITPAVPTPGSKIPSAGASR